MHKHTAFIPSIHAEAARDLLWETVSVWEDVADKVGHDDPESAIKSFSQRAFV